MNSFAVNKLGLVTLSILLKCPYCPKKFTYGRDRRRHIISAHEPENMPFKCDQCDWKGAFRKSDLENHIARKHNGDYKKKNYKKIYKKSFDAKFVCNKCGKRYQSPKSLMNHEEICDNKRTLKKEAMICERCNKTFVQKRSFEKHILKCEVTDSDQSESSSAEEPDSEPEASDSDESFFKAGGYKVSL